ncbi:hypothetical protein [Erwinia mallotivora]|nr:hypothetical protein [Erwinia mallotivora]
MNREDDMPDEGVKLSMQALERIARCAPDAAAVPLIHGNMDRVVLAAEAVWLFARRTGLDSEGEYAATAVQDLMSNLMHLCRLESITEDGEGFDDLLRMARFNFEAECGEEGED